MQELVDDIKRLREIENSVPPMFAMIFADHLKTINTLVDLVAEMSKAMDLYMEDGDDGDIEIAIAKAITKSKPITELARGNHETHST